MQLPVCVRTNGHQQLGQRSKVAQHGPSLRPEHPSSGVYELELEQLASLWVSEGTGKPLRLQYQR